MKNAGLKLLMILGIFSLSFRLFAVDVLTLEDVRSEVLSDNLEIKIQYEKYYQAQKSVQVALGQFLPRLSIEMTRLNTTLGVAQAFLPTPSGWFEYQASQEFAVAESFATEALRLNILEGLTKSFIKIKFQEKLAASAEEQTKLLTEVVKTMEAREALGAATRQQVFVAKKNLQSHKQQVFALNSIIRAEKYAMNMALSRVPTQEYVLAELPEITTDMVPNSIEEGTALALNNSPELAQNFFMREGAQYMEASARWSFISFEGIGFDYPALVSIEKSKVRVIELQGRRTELIKTSLLSMRESLFKKKSSLKLRKT
jgi:outer membrane protein TolC